MSDLKQQIEQARASLRQKLNALRAAENPNTHTVEDYTNRKRDFALSVAADVGLLLDELDRRDKATLPPETPPSAETELLAKQLRGTAARLRMEAEVLGGTHAVLASHNAGLFERAADALSSRDKIGGTHGTGNADASLTKPTA